MSVVVSVLVPTRNRPEFLDECLRSCRSDRYLLDVVVADDASDDADAVAAVAGEHGARFVEHSTVSGVAATRNRALKASVGSVLVDIDDDDMFLAGGIDDRVDALLASDRLWGYAEAVVVDEAGRYLAGSELRHPSVADSGRSWFARCLSSEVFAWAGCRVYRREVFDVVGGWDESFRVAEDFEHWLRVSSHCGDPLVIPGFTSIWRSKEHSLGIDAARSGEMGAMVRRAVEMWSVKA